MSGNENETYVSPRSLANVIKAGRLAIKKGKPLTENKNNRQTILLNPRNLFLLGENAHGWTFSYFCLTSKHKLYCFDREDVRI